MTEDQIIFLAILFAATGAVFWLLAVVRAVLRAVRRRRARARDRETFALSLAELNAVRDEQAAWRALDDGLDGLYKALGLPRDPFGEDR